MLEYLCQFEWNKELVKQSLPLTICDTVCANMISEKSSPAPGIREFVFRITARGSSENSEIFSKLKKLLLHAGEPLFLKITPADVNDSVIITDFLPEGAWQMTHLFFGGVKVPCMTWNLVVHVGKES